MLIAKLLVQDDEGQYIGLYINTYTLLLCVLQYEARVLVMAGCPVSL